MSATGGGVSSYATLLQAYGLVLETRPGRGRCVLAARDFKAGTTVLCSKPFATVIHHQHAGERCHHCFQAPAAGDTNTLLQCGACKYAKYCSKACQVAAWKSCHKRECSAREVVFAERDHDEGALACRTLWNASAKHREESDPSVSTVEQVLGMVSNADLIKARDSARHEVNMKLAAQVSKKVSAAKGCGTTTQLANEVLCKMQCNNFSIWNDLLVSVGAGVYPAGALLNHSCAGNCVLMYDTQSKTQTIRCIRGVKCGEELTHSYLDAVEPTPVRRAKLERLYHFTCDCERCHNSTLDTDIAALKGGGVLDMALLDESTRSKLMKASGMHRSAASYEHDVATSRSMAITAWEIRNSILGKYHLDLLATSCALLDLHMEAQDWSGAAKMSSHIVQVYERVYPVNHPMTGLQYYTLGDLLAQSGREREAEAALASALRILGITHGEDNRLTKDLLVRLGGEPTPTCIR